MYKVSVPIQCSCFVKKGLNELQDFSTKEEAKKAADSLKLTANECFRLKIIDEIIPEKPGGAHRFKEEQYVIVKEILSSKVKKLLKKTS